ncbi:MAG: hypothetical protein K6F35_04780 [Lachnospiraceae bacterium]|nr:hypothetical protein [Lachnospiraceae bacterium]
MGSRNGTPPMYYLGHKILINLNSFGPGSVDDPERLRFLESSMIHELMHAFMADYLMNMSLGTGRDGARVLERDADGKPREGEDGRPVLVDEIPGWLQEGLAMTVEDGYNTRREELRDFFGVDHYDEEYLTILSTPESATEALNPEYEDGEIVNMAQVTIEENTYNMGYVATLALCSFAGEKLGYKVFDENGMLNSEALFYGLNDILVRIHEGNSLDRVIADISRDPSTGEPAYADTTDFEKKCFGSAKDPGLIFLQKMLFDYEARSQKDPEQYIPCGSVLPGYVNGAQYCMDGFYHEPARVYEVANTEEGNPEGDYFSISTIRMSKVALTGGRRTSYDPYGDPLTGAEEDERDSCYIGEEKRYVDTSLEDD